MYLSCMLYLLCCCRKQAYLWAVGDAERSQEMAKKYLSSCGSEKMEKAKLLKMQEDSGVISKIRSGLGTMIIDTKGGRANEDFVVS